MRNLLWTLPVALFFLNPTFACTDEPQFQYGAAEMRAAVEGSWSFAITPTGGATIAVTVQLDQAATAPGATALQPRHALVRAAYACGTRTLVKSAGACVDMSSMPLTITVVSGDPSLSSATTSGAFDVFGLTFTQGTLQLALGPYQIQALVNPDGSVVSSTVIASGMAGTLTVSRP
jgi:hypothetical protein